MHDPDRNNFCVIYKERMKAVGCSYPDIRNAGVPLFSKTIGYSLHQRAFHFSFGKNIDGSKPAKRP